MKPTIKQRWTPLVPVPKNPESLEGRLKPHNEVYVNKTHTVTVMPCHIDQGLGDVLDGWVGLSIKRNDREAECDWRVFMRIKNELLGPDREALQLFPSMSRVVDTANQYFLWVAPKGFLVGVGFLDRLVMGQKLSAQVNQSLGNPGTPKQRDFDEGCPLGDLVGADALPKTATEGVFPIPLYPQEVLTLMRSGLQYRTDLQEGKEDEPAAD